MGPRKILVGTAVQSFWGEYPGLDARLQQLRGLVEEMAAQAADRYPGRRLDLVALPENAVTLGASESAAERAVPFAGPVEETFAELARKHQCYVVAPLDMAEGEDRDVYTNAAVLLDRQGRVAGIYRKVHPVSAIDEGRLEGGITPGREFPVFECDFGRVGIQICYDIVYDDGWEAL